MEDERAQVWDVADVEGNVLVQRVSLANLRARVDNGLLPTAAVYRRHGEPSWKPLAELLGPTAAHKVVVLWYVTRKAAPVVGPVDTDRVRRGIVANIVPFDCVVCRVGEQRWRPIGETIEFADQVRESQFEGELTLVVDSPRVDSRPPPPFARA